ncbi:MAG: DEAD/DEAH box helicase, partial [Phycisphaerales bacterium]
MHANWSRGRLHLWAESSHGSTALTGSSGNGSAGSAGPSATLVSELLQRANIATNGNCTTDRLALFLPSRSGTPTSSDQLARATDSPLPQPDGIARFEVDTLSFDAAAALCILTEIDERDAWMDHRGPSLEFLLMTARLICDLLVEQRYIPSVMHEPGQQFRAVWQAWLHDKAQRTRVNALLSCLPPAFRAVDDERSSDGWARLRDAIESILDASVREVLLRNGFADALEDTSIDDDLHVRLLDALLAPSPQLHKEHAWRDLFDWARLWSSRLERPTQTHACTLILHANEPDPVQRDTDHWTLTLGLRMEASGREYTAADLIENATVFAGAGRDDLRQALLEEVARVTAIYEQLPDALEGTTPGELSLTSAQAHEFLQRTMPILRESGVEVNPPAWWGGASSQLSLRLSLLPLESQQQGGGDSSGPGKRLGLRELVQYRWEVMVGDAVLSEAELRALARATSPLMKVADQWLVVDADQIKNAQKILEEGHGNSMTILEAVQKAYGVGGEQLGLPVQEIRAHGWIEALLNASTPDHIAMLEQPPSFHGELRPYQRAGLSWLVFLEACGLGCCLADDMGLGKTIQLIALLLHDRETLAQPPGPTLIVVPLSVVNNWHREIARFAPSLRVLVHHGPDRLLGSVFAEAANASDVVITTYGLVSRDIDTVREVEWRRVVLDEAQNVKNVNTRQAQSVRALSAERRVAMTGTPVENRLSELWSIMDFCNRGYLGTQADFRRRFAHPIERSRDARATSNLRGLIQPFVLRRLKTDRDVVPDLPDLITTREFASLTERQGAMYSAVVESMLRA